MTRSSRMVVSTALTLLCWTAVAGADPITATYHVQVTQRMTPESNPEWLPFAAEDFTLRMTFDPALVRPAGTGWSYGPATFSSVPLPAVAPPPGLPLTREGRTIHGRFEQDQLEMTDLFASASQSEFHIGSEWHYFRHMRLASQVHIGNSPVPFTADTFPAHLVLGSPFNFDYGASLFQLTPSIRLVDRVDYRGFATLIDVSSADPVPEPATLALVGGGLALLARRRHRWSPLTAR